MAEVPHSGEQLQLPVLSTVHGGGEAFCFHHCQICLGTVSLGLEKLLKYFPKFRKFQNNRIL